jgi:hypothetical protein
MPDNAPLSALNQALALKGLSFDALRRDAQAIALFGSRAAGCARPSSDWDLLCVGAGSSRKVRGLDLVWIEPHALETSVWLGGDLAGHVAAHGLWLEGEPCWDLGAVHFPMAARRKEARIARSLRALAQAWDLLGAGYRTKHATLLRRDVQRCYLLQRGLPIPPSAMLDDVWIREQYRDWFVDALIGLNAPSNLAKTLSKCAEGDDVHESASSNQR